MADQPVVRLTGDTEPKQSNKPPNFEKVVEMYQTGQFKHQPVNPDVYLTRDNYIPSTPPLKQGETAQQMPNYSQLTPTEKWIYEKLPGFSQSTVGQALAKFGESPFGKALAYLDIPAEATERIGGLASQLWNARDNPLEMQDITRDLAAAWYAGGLAADMTNLPSFNYNSDGSVISMSIPNTLPGAAGIAQARKDIANLVQQGMTHSEALQQVKSTYYDSLGALQLRAQMTDLYSHVLLDPLNYIMPLLKPVERIRVASDLVSATKWADDVLLDAKNLLRTTEDINEVAGLAAKTQLLKGEELARFNNLVKAGNLDEAKNITQGLLDSVGLTRRDNLILSITGKQDPLKVPTWRDKINPLYGFGLTPEARAQELVATIQDNVGSYIISRSDDPLEITNNISRAANGATGPEMGHAFVTVEGRAAQGMLKGIEKEATELYEQTLILQDEIADLKTIANALDMDEMKVMGMLENNDFGTVSRLTNGAFSPEELEVLVRKLEGMPYSPKVFKLQLTNKIADHAAHQAVMMFGVKQRGFAQKLASAVKSAETLAFLRLNPGYFVRNVLNNEMTMIGRGLGVNMDDLQKVVSDVIGFTPHRMKDGFGAIGDALGAPVDEASKIINDAAIGTRGSLDRFTEWINGIKPLGRFDMGQLSARAERSASQRAFVTGYLQGWNRYFWKPGKGFDDAATFLPAYVQDQLNTIDKGIIPAMNKMIASAKSPEDLEKIFRGNLNLSLRNIMDEASESLGYKVDDALPDEFVAKIEKGLREAAEQGPDATRTYFTRVRQELQEHLDELSKNTVEQVRDWTAAQITAEGPGAFVKIWANQMDLWHEAGIYHAESMESIADAIRRQTDPELIHAMWRALADRNDKFYSRHWDRFDGTVQGMVKGAKANNIPISDEVVDVFKEIKRGWRDWWKNKRKLQSDYWEARRAGEKPERTWADIQDEFNKTYREMTGKEEELTGRLNKLVGNALPDEFKEPFVIWRRGADDLRRADKEMVMQFQEEVKGMTAEQRAEAWVGFWRDRIQRHEEMRQWEHVGNTALAGDEASIQRLQQVADVSPPSEEAAPAAREIAPVAEEIIEEAIELPEEVMFAWRANESNQAKVKELRRLKKEADSYNASLPPGSTSPRKYLGQELQDAENYARGSGMRLSGILKEHGLTRDDVRRALGELPVEKAPAAPPVAPPAPKMEMPSIPDIGAVVRKPLDQVTAQDTYWMTRGMPSLDAMERAALDQIGKPPLKWDTISDDAKEIMEGYLKHVQGQMSDARYASTRFAEYKRDAALLNYNRRTNFDTYATMIFPYQFWFTHSAVQWLLHSVDRPAMLSTFLRLKEFMNTAGSPKQALPSRLKGSIRVGVPFLPPEMGDSIFFDPMRALLPFDTFAYPWERRMQQQSSLEGRTEFILNDMLENGQISEEEHAEALADPQSDLWKRAQSMAIDDDQDLRFNVWDFASTLSAPHAPLVWAYQSLMGTPENIPPFTPASRTIKGAAGLLGVDWDRSPMNIEGRIRKELGLPAFDKWDDYRIDRMLSNMTALGDITAEEALRAMIEREGPAFDAAAKKAAFEFGIGAMGSTLGIPAKAYPEGEFLQRSMADDYQNAWANYEEGDDSPYKRFMLMHPEYETRLALWKEPEERLRNFLVDDMWNIWFDLPSLTKKELMEQIPELEEKFVNKDTRNYEAIEIGELQSWLKLLGGDPPGTLNSEPAPIDLADPEVAWRAQVFYNMRNQYFPDWFDIQKEYYNIPEENKNERKAYRNANPDLVSYWDWRRDYFHRNPDVVPYLTDKEYEFKYSTPQAQQRAEEPAPWFTWDEWRAIMGPNASRLMLDFIERGDPIPPTMVEQMDELAENLNVNQQEMYDLIYDSLGVAPEDREPGFTQQEVPPAQQVAPLTESEGELTRYREPGEPKPWKVDPRLSDKAKDIIGRNADVLWAGRVPGITQQAGQSVEAASFMGFYPETIARREEGGFKRFFAAFGGVPNEETYLHELAHAIDFSEKISDNPDFVEDAQRYMKDYEPSYPDTHNREWWAMLFARSVTGNQFVPDYIEKWIKPYKK